MAIRKASGELACTYAVGNSATFPVGVDPNKLYVGTTWIRIKGKVIVGVDENDTSFNTPNKVGGSKTHTLTVAQMPTHHHKPHEWNWIMSKGSNTGSFNISGFEGSRGNTNYFGADSDKNRFGESAGSGQAHNNLQPYITKYVWERIS